MSQPCSCQGDKENRSTAGEFLESPVVSYCLTFPVYLWGITLPNLPDLFWMLGLGCGVTDGCWAWARASISAQFFSPKCLLQAQLLQPEVEGQCSEVQLPRVKLRSVLMKIYDLKKRGVFSLAVSWGFKLCSCDLISFLKLVQSEGGAALTCATRCHFPNLNGDFKEPQPWAGEAAVLPDIFTIIHELFPATKCPFLAEKRSQDTQINS